ncbi:Concanavalin A-like lectin family protein [Raphanus sativus]|uniref:L-type lectin-domain containing receptor kinase IV.2 n=1 Tax=Raphanus sativus TaxID=3726 RepID=A0A6J0KQY7_RAPSA|nr:L-type lectin-domain containing receptor kinase IV.2 [Raphanus sativus]KAJ4911528.1 Concanavalin A-like lectin family protein [Raphanus sativus]
MAFLKALAFLFVLTFETTADADSSFSFNGFAKSPSFDNNIALFRDSKLLVNGGGGSSIQLTGSVTRSEGRVLYKKPIKLFQGTTKERRNFSGSFSTSFSFSMMSSSREIGSVLSFVMVPSGLDLRLFARKDNNTSSSGLGFLSRNEIVAVEFGVSKRGNRVGVLVGRPQSARIRNLSSFGGGFDEVSCWIDYEASSKRIEVRLSLSDDLKPVDPFISYSVDLGKIWKEKKFMVGLTSANGNSSKPHYLRSWSFKLRHPSMRIHSQPLDPNAVVSKTVKDEERKTVEVKGKGKSKCVWRMFSALVLGGVCGTLGAMFALYLWTICGNRRSMAVVPEECGNDKSDIVVMKAAAVVDEEAKN